MGGVGGGVNKAPGRQEVAGGIPFIDLVSERRQSSRGRIFVGLIPQVHKDRVAAGGQGVLVVRFGCKNISLTINPLGELVCWAAAAARCTRRRRVCADRGGKLVTLFLIGAEIPSSRALSATPPGGNAD